MTNTRHKSAYNILNTPSLAPASEKKREDGNASNLVSVLSGQKLHFRELSVEVIRQLLAERQQLRDRNRAAILNEISDISSDISCCENLQYSIEARETRIKLLKHKADLENLLREENVGLWKDTEELRRLLVDADKNLDSARLRADLFGTMINNEDKRTDNTKNSEHMQGP